MRRTLVLSLGIVLCGGLIRVAGQVAGALPAPPPGFKVDQNFADMEAKMRALGVSDGVRATKPNDNYPKNCAGNDVGIELTYGWTKNTMARQVVEMMAQSPEDPVSGSPGDLLLDEPAGKGWYKGGVLTWRKITRRIAGVSAACDTEVTYKGNWQGSSGDKAIYISVVRVYGSKASAQALIDECIDKVLHALQSK